LNAVVYFYSSNVTQVPSKKPKFLGGDGYGDDIRFDPKEGDFQIFVSMNALAPIFKDISDNKKFHINLRPEGLPKSLVPLVSLNIDGLNAILPDIHTYFARDENVTVVGQVTLLDTDPELPTTGVATVNFNIYNTINPTSLLNFVSTFNYALGPHLNGTDLNFKLRSADLLHTTIKSSNTTNVNAAALNDLMETLITTYIDNEDFYNLFKKPIQLGNYFKTIQTIKETYDGVLLGGTTYETPTSHTEMKTNFLRKLFESI